MERACVAAERGGLELEVALCRHPGQVHDGLSEATGPVLLMTHGFFGEDAFTNNGTDEKYQTAELNDMAPDRIGASALFVLACYQDASSWAARMPAGSLLVTTPNHLVTSAVRQFAPALAVAQPREAAEVSALLQLVAYRRRDDSIMHALGDGTVEAILAVTDSAVSTLATRTWEARRI